MRKPILLFTLLLISGMLVISIAETNSTSAETEIVFFYYSYSSGSFWSGYQKLEVWIFWNETIRVKFDLPENKSITY